MGRRVYGHVVRGVRYWRHFNMFWLTIIVGVPVAMISVLTNHLIDFLDVAGGIAAFTGFCRLVEQMLNTLGAAAWSLDSEDVSWTSGSDMSEPSPFLFLPPVGWPTFR
jgi:hypothetical protein